jgi:hypothetical protein
MKYSDRLKDPRWQRAVTLVDTSLLPFWKDKLPNDAHAVHNIRYAVAMSTLTPGEADMTSEQHAALLERYIRHYVGDKYVAALLEQCEQVVRSVLR